MEEDVVAVDFETYYDKDYSLTKMPTVQYVRDREFDPYLVAVYSPTERFVGDPRAYDWRRIAGKRWVAHNAYFDSCAYEEMQRRGWVDKSISPREWVCSADMAAYLRIKRDLATVAKELLGRDLSKAVRAKMKGVRWEQVRGTTDEAAVVKYGDTDAVNCYDVFQAGAADWPAHEQRISAISRERGKIGTHILWDKVEQAVNDLNDCLFFAGRAIPWDWSDYKTPLAPALIRPHCRDIGIPFPASFAIDDPDCEEWMDTYGDKFPWVRAIRDWRRVNMLLAKVKTMQACRHPDTDRMPLALKYGGAHTMRWSGSEKFNPQNLPREAMTFNKSETETASVDLRGMLWAGPGKKFVIADYSSIEAVVLRWLVKDRVTLDRFAAGENMYHIHAVNTMGYSGPDLKKAQHNSEDLGRLYRLAKARVLALGYGCGWEKFITMAAKLAQLTLDEEQSKAAVYGFRESEPGITGYWNARHTGMLRSVINGDPDYTVGLPSGRCMSYFNPITRLAPDTRTKKMRSEYFARFRRGEEHQRIYGGKITENVDQAIARDIMVDGWLKLVDAGVDVMTTTHDEFVCVVDESSAESDAREIERIISKPPDWMPDIPLRFDISANETYCKG